MGSNKLQPFDHVARLALYEAGNSDGQIGKAEGVPGSVICDWRRRHKLPSKHAHHYRPRGDPTQLNERNKRIIPQLLAKGMLFDEIAAAIRKPLAAVTAWCEATGRHPVRPSALSVADLWVIVAAVMPPGRAKQIREAAMSDMLIDLVDGKLHPDQARHNVGRYINRAAGLFTREYVQADIEDWSIADDAQLSALRIIELSALATRLGIDPAAALSA